MLDDFNIPDGFILLIIDYNVTIDTSSYMCWRVCVCVCEKEREREGGREKERERRETRARDACSRVHVI